jgi:DNA-binding transcriptional ArsR family regulator
VPTGDPPDLPDGARRLLAGPVDSFEKLEVVLALREAGGPLALDALVARAGVPVGDIERALGELAAAGLVEKRRDGTWRVCGDSQALADLAVAWGTRRLAVLQAMTGRAVGRIRASAARVFADAFRLRRRRDEGDDDG